MGSTPPPRIVPKGPTAQDKSKWIAMNHLLPASEDEVAMARSTEARLVDYKANSPDGRVRVVFHMGNLTELGPIGHGHYTTTSYYQLIDTRSGKSLARVESKLSKQWDRDRQDQKVWYSLDGQTALIFESLTDGDECLGVYALLRFHPGDSSWTLKYLEPPKFGGLPVRETDPTPAGLLGDMIVLDAWTPGQFHKMKISDIPACRAPLPFTIG